MKIADGLFYYPWTSFYENNCNTYVIGENAKLLIDPGHAHLFTNVQQAMDKDGLDWRDIELVACTHSHPDHFEGVEAYYDQETAKIALNPTEARFLAEVGPMFARMMGLEMPKYRIDLDLNEGELEFDGLRLQVFHTPGHSPGHVCLYWAEAKVLFSGDLIFNQGVGRTDFPGGDGGLLKESIKRMAELDVELVLSGHGDPVQGREAVRRNFEIIEKTYFDWI